MLWSVSSLLRKPLELYRKFMLSSYSDQSCALGSIREDDRFSRSLALSFPPIHYKFPTFLIFFFEHGEVPKDLDTIILFQSGDYNLH
jgi:hypothetical protein